MAKFLFYDHMLINILSEPEKPSGGAAVQTYGWIRGLLALNQEVFALTNFNGKELIKKQCQDINLVPLYDTKKGIRLVRWIYYRIPYIYRKLKEIKPDYLYLSVPDWTSYLIAIMCRLLKIKFIQRISNDFIVDARMLQKRSRLHIFLMHKGLRMSDCIFCQNDYQVSCILKKHPNNTVFKLSNPIYDVHTGDSPGRESRNYIAWLGVFQYQKNLKLLFEIARALPHKQFHVAGKEDPKCDIETIWYLARIAALPNVTMVGFLKREDVFPFLSGAEYLLNTSHYEGFSNTFLEAMSAGTPILSSSNVNPDNIIPKFNLGIIYETVETLVAKIQSVSIIDYKRMSLAVQQYLDTQHNYKQLTKQLLDFINETPSLHFPFSIDVSYHGNQLNNRITRHTIIKNNAS